MLALGFRETGEVEDDVVLTSGAAEATAKVAGTITVTRSTSIKRGGRTAAGAAGAGAGATGRLTRARPTAVMQRRKPRTTAARKSSRGWFPLRRTFETFYSKLAVYL
jgi:hypothetical protein